MVDRSIEPTSPMEVEQHHGCHSCASHETGNGKKTKSRPTNKSRAGSGDGDRTSVKLRHSCRSCADSKVRCDKEKPRCSRCDARDLPCEYLQSKRPGRVPGASLRQKQAKQAADKSNQGIESISPAVNNQFSSRDANMGGGPFRLEDFTLDLSQQHARRAMSVSSTSSASHLDGYTAASSPGLDAESSAAQACKAPIAPMVTPTTDSNMDDLVYFNNLMDDTLNLVDMDSFWPTGDDYGNIVDIDLANFTNMSASPNLPQEDALSTPTQTSSAVPSSSSSIVHLQDMLGMTAKTPSQASGHNQVKSTSPAKSLSSILGPIAKSSSQSCTCMVRALEILKTLSANETTDTSSTVAEHHTQRVLQDNKQDIDANLAMLACQNCSSDRFLLMILLMNAAKIFKRYASAAALCRSCTSSNVPGTPNSVEQTSFIPDHSNQQMEMSRAWDGVSTILSAPKATCESQTTCREAVQGVLRELHRLQRLLTQLTIRRENLRGEEESKNLAAGLTDTFAGSLKMRDRSGSQISSLSGTASPGAAASSVPTPHLHDDALRLVEEDVRNGLSVLSAVIRDLLNNS